MKECVAPASNKTLVDRVFTGNIPDTTVFGSSPLSSAFKQNTQPPAWGFLVFLACWLAQVVRARPQFVGAGGLG